MVPGESKEGGVHRNGRSPLKGQWGVQRTKERNGNLERGRAAMAAFPNRTGRLP